MQRCPFQQLSEATGGFDEIDCRIQTGFSFHVITAKPDAATITKICQSDKCRAIMARMQAAAPQELWGFAASISISASVFANAVSRTSYDSSGSSSSNGVTIGVIVGAAVGVVVASLLTLLFVKRNRRQEGGKYWRHSDAHARPAASGANAQHSNGKARSAAADTASSGSAGSRSYKPHPEPKPKPKPKPSAAGGLWDDASITQARIPMEDIALGDVLSRGAFGEVLRGQYRGETVAVKRLLPDRRKNMREIEAFLEEAKLMTGLQHERVVRLIGVSWDSLTDLCVVVEFLPGGDLRSLLARFDAERRPTGFSSDKVKIALHVAHALAYLHGMSSPIVHRDLKSKNVLLDERLDAKLTDFGVSRHKGDSTMTAGVGSMLWMAPEVMVGARYDAKADVFSLGVVLSELDSQQLPYAHAREKETGRRLPDAAILQMVSLGTLTVEFSADADAEIVDLARACVALEPAHRPSSADVLHRLHRVWRSYGGFM
ncbi:hypothetical protein ATCC90586_009351 [Pythium insidiosum]|nr:hypothetical protein ATCC90586_009351 [Pythium insidiosum]